MKILTFLGPSNYAFTRYRYDGKTVPTRFFAEALPQYFPGTEKILAFVTPTVQKHSNLEELSSRLGDLLQPVPTPESHTEEALWQVFDALIGNVEPGEEVIFDITSSFRSIPFLVFGASAATCAGWMKCNPTCRSRHPQRWGKISESLGMAGWSGAGIMKDKWL